MDEELTPDYDPGSTNEAGPGSEETDKKYGRNDKNLPFEIIDALRQGDVDAFENVYTHMGGPIEDFLAALIQSREDARELTQDVFINVWENHARIESGKNLKGYIYTLSKFYAFDYIKRRKVASRYVDNMMHTASTLDYSADDIIDARETELLIRITLDSMPERRKRAFEMSRFEGKSDDEIARELNLTKPTVQVYVSTVAKELRKVIGLFTTIFLT